MNQKFPLDRTQRLETVAISARWGRREEMVGVRADLEAMGCKVVSSWIDDYSQEQDLSPAELRDIAKRDAREIRSASVFIAFTEPPGEEVSGATRGGRHVEFGIALEVAEVILVVGPRENVFHWRGVVDHYDDWEHARTDLARWIEQLG